MQRTPRRHAPGIDINAIRAEGYKEGYDAALSFVTKKLSDGMMPICRAISNHLELDFSEIRTTPRSEPITHTDTDPLRGDGSHE